MSTKNEDYELDPVFVNAKREAKIILVSFAVFAVYTLSVSYSLGWHSDHPGDTEPSMVLGIPSWVFWGILVPWIFANLVTGWFCFRFMRDDLLTDTQQAADSPGDASGGIDSDSQSTIGEQHA